MLVDKVRIKEVMNKNNIKTQTQLASMLGITKNQLSVMLSEKYNPIKSNMIELCSILNISPLDIIKENTRSSDIIDIDKNGINAIELFAGAGGIAIGLEQAGINTVQFVEIDKYCCATLRKNRPNWNVTNEDVTIVDFMRYKGKVNIVTGGFPCQAFSYAGKKLGFEDTRGTLFYEFARCVKEVEPIIFMAENVKGLESHNDGKTLDTILSVLRGLGYHVEYRIMNSMNYNVPQKRQRLVIIGTKENAVFKFPDETKQIKTLKDALCDVPNSEGQKYSANKKQVLDLVPPGSCWRSLPLEIQKSYMGKSYYSSGGRTGIARRISWDEPCLTLTCSPSQKQTERCHPDETRPFTVREYARIQTFPDDWEFCGGIGQKYKQIGNAVPIELARQLGIEIYNTVKGYINKV